MSSFKELKQFFETKHQTQKIKEIKESCSDHDIQVIDFDQLVKDFSTELKMQPPPSCDCLYFCKYKSEIVFIEMRRYKAFFDTIPNYKNSEEFLKVLKTRIDEDRFDDKIIFSYAVLLSYLGYNDAKKFFSLLLNGSNSGDKIGIRFIVKSDIDDLTWMKWFGIDKGKVNNKIEYKFLNQISGFIRPSNFASLVQYLDKPE